MTEISKGTDDQQRVCSDIVISIKTMLEPLLEVGAQRSINNNTCRIPKGLLEMNEKAYVPQFISIGPFHHRARDDLVANERYKLHGFINFLSRMNDKKDIESMKDGFAETKSLNELVEKSHCWVKEAWNWYGTPINMNEKEFIKMMLVDACFIVEFIILRENFFNNQLPAKFNVDVSFYFGVHANILYDLIKLENQVPFVLLQNLFDLIPKEDVLAHTSFTTLAVSAFKIGIMMELAIINSSKLNPKHLVDLLGFYFVPFDNNLDHMHNNNCFGRLFRILFPTNNNQKQQLHEKKNIEKKENDCLSFFRFPACCRHRWNKKNKSEKDSLLSPPSITEICEAGVTIKKAQDPKHIWNISFKNGVLEIPPLHIYDEFELMLRNMLAFEQLCNTNFTNKYVNQYVYFMDDLISTEKDVRLLVEAGIIINDIGGSDKEVSDMFNHLCKGLTLTRSLKFTQISNDLHKHCNGWWNKAKASLKHNYFNTPWAIISFFAATLLIILTILQTIFSAISTFPKPA